MISLQDSRTTVQELPLASFGLQANAVACGVAVTEASDYEEP